MPWQGLWLFGGLRYGFGTNDSVGLALDILNIDEGFAALVAATLALVSAIYSIRVSISASRLAARQSIIGEDLKRLSTAIYEVVALSVKAMDARDPDRFDERIQQATEVAKQLDVLRREHRYTLPFIFEPIWYLKGLPNYVSHHRNDRQNARLALIREDATHLREAIDEALERYFFDGKRPNIVLNWRLRWLGRKLEKRFKDGKPE